MEKQNIARKAAAKMPILTGYAVRIPLCFVSVQRTHLPRYYYIEYESAGIQLNGSSSPRRRYGWVGSRVSTSLR